MSRPPFHKLPLLALGLALLAAQPAHAVSKEMIQLQTQVQQLQDAVARLQQSNDERMGVLKDLVQQTADAVNQMSVTVNGMKLATQNQQDAATTRGEQMSGQIQSLNDTLDELKARMARIEKALGDIQGQQQTTAAALANLPQVTMSQPAAGAAAPGQPLPAGPANTPTPAPIDRTPPPAADAPPTQNATAMYRTAFNDYMSAKYSLASNEFANVIKTFPDDNLSGNAYFYLGEINLRAQKYPAAVKSYDAVLERYPDNNKIPSAHLHKADALLALRQNDAAIRELRALVQRFPNSPEAAQAKVKLNALHAPRE